jgi:hypothetical protein
VNIEEFLGLKLFKFGKCVLKYFKEPENFKMSPKKVEDLTKNPGFENV